MKVRRLFTLVAFVFSLSAGWLTLLPSVAQAAGATFKWVDPINISASGGRFKGTANFKGINNYNPNASINQYNGSITDSSGCTMTATIQIKQGDPGSGTLFLNPNKAGSNPAPVCSQSIISQYPTSISVGNTGAATAAPPTKDDPKDENVDVIADPVSTIENADDVSSAPKTDTITLKKDGKVIATKTANASAVAGRLNYSVTFTGVAAGTYSVCSVVAANCADFTRQVQQTLPAVHIEGKNASIAAPGDAGPDCDAGSFTWMICPLIDLTLKTTDSIRTNVIAPLLQVNPLDQTGPIHSMWSAVRDLADVLFVILFLVMIFGTAMGMDNYTVKKVLPRLVAAAVLIQFSFIIAGVLIDVGNVTGDGLDALSKYNNIIPTPSFDFTNAKSQAGAVASVVTGAALLTGAAIGLTLTTVIGAFIGVLVLFFTLLLRQILITLLVILAPLAFAAWILPNTERFFKTWYKELLRTIMLYPLVILAFIAGRIFAASALATGGQFHNLFALAGYVLPLFVIPAVFAAAGKMVSAGTGFINKAAKAGNGKFGSGSDFAKGRAEQRQANNALRANNQDASMFTRAIARKRGGFGPMIAGDNKILNKVPLMHQSVADQRRTLQAGDKARNDRIGIARVKMGDIPLGETDKLVDSFNKGDFATKTAAIERLGMTAGGRKKLAPIYDQLKKEGMKEGSENYRIWADGIGGNIATIKSSNPDFVKPMENVITSVAPAEAAKFDPAFAARYVNELNSLDMSDPKNQESMDVAARAINGIVKSPTLRGQIEPDTMKELSKLQSPDIQSSVNEYFNGNTPSAAGQTTPIINPPATGVPTLTSAATSSPTTPVSNAINVPTTTPSSPSPGTSGTPLVTNNNISNVSNNAPQAGQSYAPPAAGRQPAPSERLQPQSINVNAKLDVSDLTTAIKRSGMADRAVPTVGDRNTYPPGTNIPPATPPTNPALVDPKSEGQDDEPGDERSVS